MAKDGLNKEAKNALKNAKQPMFIVKPASRMLGLDMLHVSLIVLVIILVALVFALVNFQSPVVQSCFGTSNAICTPPVHNASQALAAAESVIAGYQLANSSIVLLPYYSLPNMANATFLPQQREWFVRIPYRDPTAGDRLGNFSLLLYDSNLSLAQPFLQIFSPLLKTNDQTVAYGVVSLAGKVPCSSKPPYQTYVFIDPYAPGSMIAIGNAINFTKEHSSMLNTTYKMIFTTYAESHYANYGVLQTQNLGAYLACASKQKNFPWFISNLSTIFTGIPLSNITLQNVVISSDLNRTQFGECMQNSAAMLNGMALQATFYNITTTPLFVLNCKFQTLPEQVDSAYGYMLNNSG
jgi:hypothetical protein